MPLSPLRFQLFFLLTLLLGTSPTFAEWKAVPVDEANLQQWFGSDYHASNGRPGFFDASGIERVPGCSEGPQPFFAPDGTPLGAPLAPSDGRFAFFADFGDDDVLTPGENLLVYFAGGGACWDEATCIGSALTLNSTYFPATFEDADTLNFASNDEASGILAKLPGENPYADFAKVYIPYCTGDVHIGSNDTTYVYPPLLAPIFGVDSPAWTIRHRGFDNLLAVLKWLQLNNAGASGKLTVAGSSAGGYGALINFPTVRGAIGNAPDYSVIVDSSSGVLTDGFLNRAFGGRGDDGVWGIWEGETIHPLLEDVVEFDGADSLWLNAFRTVGGAYRDTRISQSTAAYDIVQAIVLLNMKKVDNGTYDPFIQPDGNEVALTALLDWSPKARLTMLSTAFSVPNYRYYLGAGQGHIHLIDPPPEVFPFPTTNYYDENSARGIYYTDWLDDMLNNPRRFFRTDWKNLSCFPGCVQ